MKARFLALLALVLGLASCQTEPEGLDVMVGGDGNATISVVLPEDAITRAGGTNSAESGLANKTGEIVRVVMRIYDENGRVSDKRYVDYLEDGDLVANFDVRLVPDRDYTFVAWADQVDAKEDVDKYFDTQDLSNVTFVANTWTAMEEARDAYTATEKVVDFNSSKSVTLKLTRPFAKLRVVTTDMAALEDLNIEPKQAKVDYTVALPNSFNAVTGKVGTTTETKSFPLFDIAEYTGDTEGSKTLFTDYILVPESGVVKFTMDVNDQNDGLIKANAFTTDIAIKRNNLTTIAGNILTDGKNVNVEVKPGFGDEIERPVANDANTLQNAINDAEDGKETTITLGGDVNLNDLLSAGTLSTRTGEAKGLTIGANKVIILDLAGYTISMTKECANSYSMIVNNGTLTISGNGTISFTDTSAGGGSDWGTYTINNYGTLVVNGATIEHLGSTGNWGTNRPTCIPIQNYAGKVTVNSGVISSPMFRSLRDFTAGGEIIINGGEFKGQVWMQGLGSGSSSLTINGGEFAPTAGYDGSSIFITNGTNDINVAVNGGFFNTKIGCTDANKAGVKGCIVGGTFTATAIENTNAALIANGHTAVDNGDDTYTVINLRGSEVEIYGLTLKPNGDNSKIIVNDKEGFMNLTKLFNDWTALFTDGNGTTYTNYANGAGVDYYYAGRWTVSLEADIDLNNANISPIIINHPVSAGKPTFTGNNHTIKNAKIDTDTATENEAGLFGSSSCGFNNLKLDNIHVTGSNVGNSTAGVLAGSNSVGIDNITITNSSVEGGKYTGGVIGYVYTDVTNCTLTNVSVKGGYKLGGLIGYICASGDNTGEVTGNTLTECSVDGIGNGIYAGGKSEYIIGMLVGNYNCDGTCKDNVVYDMTTTANKIIGKIEAGKVVNESNNIVTYVAKNYESLKNAIAAGADTILIKGELDLTTAILSGYNGTIIGADDTAVINTRNYTPSSNEAYQLRSNNLTFKNIDVKLPTGGDWIQSGFVGTGTIVFDECNFVGQATLNGSATWIFNDCTFVSTESGKYASFVYGATKATFNRCSFSGVERAAKVYGTGGTLNVEYNTCEFTSSSLNKSGVEIDASYATTTVALNNCTQTAMAGLFALEGSKGTVLIDGYTWVADGLTKKDNEYNVSNANGLAVLNGMMANKTAGRSTVVNLSADINFAGKTWTPVDSHADTSFTFAKLNGNGHTISNLTIDGQAMFKRFAGSGDVTVENVTFDNATVNSTTINTSILTVQTYQNVLLDNVDIKNSSINGGYKVAPLIATVYNENPATTITATLKNCDVENVTVKATSYDFCTTGMVAFVYADDNDTIAFENCTVKDVKLMAPNDSYKAHAAIYTTGSESLYNEAEGVTVTNVTFEAL